MALKFKVKKKVVLKRMEEMKITQSFIAELLGMSKQNFNMILHGKQGTTKENLIKICKILSLDLNSILIML